MMGMLLCEAEVQWQMQRERQGSMLTNGSYFWMQSPGNQGMRKSSMPSHTGGGWLSVLNGWYRANSQERRAILVLLFPTVQLERFLNGWHAQPPSQLCWGAGQQRNENQPSQLLALRSGHSPMSPCGRTASLLCRLEKPSPSMFSKQAPT